MQLNERPPESMSRAQILALCAIAVLFAGWLLYRTVDFDRNSRDYSGIQSVIAADAGGYYAYLPAYFIYDFHEPPADVVRNKDGFRYVDGRLDSKYPVGTAVMQSPFFLAAHTMATQKDGYTQPYHLGVRIAGIAYAFFGVLFCFFIFCRRTGWRLSVLLCLLLFFATHLHYYTIFESGYSHVYSFFLIALLFLLLDPLKAKRGWEKLLVLPVIALIILVRPVNAIVIIPALFWNGSPLAIWTAWKAMDRTARFKWLFSLLVAAGIISLQLLHNLHATGSIAGKIYPDESLSNWLTPRFDIVLIGTQAGLFLYTPLFLLLTCAAIYGAVHKLRNFRMLMVFFALTIYVYAAWSSPGLGCSFSHRGQVDFLVLWFFPLVIVLQHLLTRNRNMVLAGIALLCVACLIYTDVLTKSWWYCAYGNGDFDYAWWWNEVCRAFEQRA